MRALVPLLAVLFLAFPAWAEQQSTNDIMLKMQHDLNLSGDQTAKITQVVDRYVMATMDLDHGVQDGTMNASEVDSQRQQLKAQEEQGIAQYLRSDQLYEWQQIEGQGGQTSGQSESGSEGGDPDGEGQGSDQYSNLPQNP